MIDCHAHLGEFEDDIENMISRARAANVIGAVMVPEYPKNFQRNLNLAERYPDFLYPALGLHPIQGSYSVPEESSPCDLELVQDAKDFIRANSERIICVGKG